MTYNKPLTDQEMDYIKKNISLPSTTIADALGRSESSVNRYKQKIKHSAPSAPTIKRYVKPFKEWRPAPHPREVDINQHPKMISLCSKVRYFNES